MWVVDHQGLGWYEELWVSLASPVRRRGEAGCIALHTLVSLAEIQIQ